eukprot:GFYU01001908.1.p2 GENE.GFYU01001908.1~~GFYU01001908.1.p2  ORF type:complete len:739 (+),score=243.77 GFYU01001908.1:31-2217(+)
MAGIDLKVPTDDSVGTALIFVCGIVSLLFAAFRTYQITLIKLDESAKTDLVSAPKVNKIAEITAAIANGATSFLFTEYMYMAVFMVLYAILVLLAVGFAEDFTLGAFSAVAFVLGAITSILSGFVGMKIAVYANGRVALEAVKGYAPAFTAAFGAGSVMGFSLCGAGTLILYISILIFRAHYSETEQVGHLMEAVAGYGLGGSSIALFGRVGGGIYTKAADVGADLVGKVEQGIPEDDPRNPATIADNVGDNVGDVAGMGADLFGSFAESTCAALVISSGSSLGLEWSCMLFPILVSSIGILVCLFTSFYATSVKPVTCKEEIEPALKAQLVISTVLMTGAVMGLAYGFLPQVDFYLPGTQVGTTIESTWWKVAVCVLCGLWAGLLIGFITEYYTSHSYGPVREVSNSCKTGAATNVIYGLALGYKSCIVPVIALAVAIYVSFKLAGMYGIACAALGMLSTLATGLTIDGYGPISDNAGGIAEMAELGDDIRERTDALDAAGNTTAAIGKGFAIGSAALVSLALFSAYIVRVRPEDISVTRPFVFTGLLVGSMLPYAFSAMTMKSVGLAANEMVEEVRRQFREIPGLMEGTGTPDYKRCVEISTQASLREMIAPGALVLLSPLVVGLFFGSEALAGLLAGGLVSGVQMAISASNTGGAWDNAKKYIEAGNLGGKGTDVHAAAVIGDTVGDPLKDTSGPALNILMKLMAINSLVFAPFFRDYGGLLNKI